MAGHTVFEAIVRVFSVASNVFNPQLTTATNHTKKNAKNIAIETALKTASVSRLKEPPRLSMNAFSAQSNRVAKVQIR